MFFVLSGYAKSPGTVFTLHTFFSGAHEMCITISVWVTKAIMKHVEVESYIFLMVLMDLLIVRMPFTGCMFHVMGSHWN